MHRPTCTLFNFERERVNLFYSKLVLNSTSDVMECIMYDHFPDLVYLSNHDVIDMSQIITDNFTTKLFRQKFT